MNNEKLHKIMDLCLEAKKRGHDCFLKYSGHVDRLEFHVYLFGWCAETKPDYKVDIKLNCANDTYYPNTDVELDKVISFLEEVINIDDKNVKLNTFLRNFNSIILNWQDTNIKDFELSNLLTKIELTFSIPALNDEEFNTKNPDVMELYRNVSNERSFIKDLKA